MATILNSNQTVIALNALNCLKKKLTQILNEHKDQLQESDSEFDLKKFNKTNKAITNLTAEISEIEKLLTNIQIQTKR